MRDTGSHTRSATRRTQWPKRWRPSHQHLQGFAPNILSLLNLLLKLKIAGPTIPMYTTGRLVSGLQGCTLAYLFFSSIGNLPDCFSLCFHSLRVSSPWSPRTSVGRMNVCRPVHAYVFRGVFLRGVPVCCSFFGSSVGLPWCHRLARERPWRHLPDRTPS